VSSTTTVLVTGGASGIGLAIGQRLLELGRRVVILDLSTENLASAANALERYEERVAFAKLDVTQESEIGEVLAAHDLADAPLVGLVNSAGFGKDIPFLETPTKTLRDILEVNVIGTFAVSREAAKRMIANGGGSIVHISSVSGLIGSKGRSAYGASKAAVVNLTQVMSNELAKHRVRVNCVCPGPIDTPLAQREHAVGGGRGLWLQAVPMKRYGTTREVAGTVSFLLDDDQSGFVTGQVISVDGGFMAAGLMAE